MILAGFRWGAGSPLGMGSIDLVSVSGVIDCSSWRLSIAGLGVRSAGLARCGSESCPEIVIVSRVVTEVARSGLGHRISYATTSTDGKSLMLLSINADLDSDCSILGR
jgi:hypothetical protein